MRNLRQKLNDMLRKHPSTAKDMADIFDYMDHLASLPRNGRHNANKSYSKTSNGSIREHRENSLSHDLVAGPHLVHEAFKKIVAQGHAKYCLVGDYKCHVNETAMRLIIRFLLHSELIIRSRSRYKITMPAKEWKEAAMKAYKELPGDWEQK